MPRFAALALLLALTVAAVPAGAGSWEGSIQGLNCVTRGQVCPINMEDPLVALEKTFVLLVGGGEFYYLPNLDRAILARHLNRAVRVEGRLRPGSKSITVDKLMVSRGRAWREVWSPQLERELAEQLQNWGQGHKQR